PCRSCQPEASQTTWTLQVDQPCDDNNPCTINTTCSDEGQCLGESRVCDDDNSCTDDSCVTPTGCIYLSNNDVCEDGEPCTLQGKCEDGSCVFKDKIECDDANPCTDDTCTAGLGCVFLPNQATCVADADPCTKDLCIQGTCAAVVSSSVCTIGGNCVAAGDTASGNPCLVCDPSQNTEKWTVKSGASCDDGNACTALDACSQGACVGKALVCKDNSPCTLDKCDPNLGCTFVAATGGCDDGNECTKPDLCIAGLCKGTPLTALDCDDGNPCTDDSCIAAVGCNHKPNGIKCDDNDACTKYDFCNAGKCIAGKLVCPCEFNSDCDDQNVCTADTCIEGVGCENLPITQPKTCVDGDACTVGDSCINGVCQGTALVCTDGNICTETACASAAGCVVKPLQGKPCDDQSACTAGDLCVDGLCKGTPKGCDDGNACTDDSCAPATGTCAHAPTNDGQPCSDDGLICTIDVCQSGTCQHTTVAADYCLIQGACISGGAQSKVQFCEACLPKIKQGDWSVWVGQKCDDGNPCTTSTLCTAAGQCKGAPLSCDDQNPCTFDACDPKFAAMGSPCISANKPGLCDDGNACTSSDTCAQGACVGKPVLCDDGKICTTDACDLKQGCVTSDAKTGLTCKDDGLPCTTDSCSKGLCIHPPKMGWCAIGTACIAKGATAGQSGDKACIACEPQSSSKSWTPLQSASCDDGDPCTGQDICQGGSCKGDPTKACDDQNPCTLDSCSQTQGCSWKAKTGNCEDGNPCTIGDQCVAGTCLPGAAKTCLTNAKDEVACLVNVCVPEQGGCSLQSTCGPLHSCIESLCLTKISGSSNVGSVAIPLTPGLTTQPRRPTVAWQKSWPGPLGAVPQLWVAAETSSCDPKMGVSSELVTVRFPVAQSKVVLTTIKTKPPLGGQHWCHS
ncbi:MAG TPA: hypothetical protein DCQ06_10900, partial [Myxococcales bacterium]|nr:hypothetical protein [Myxococcales bacterium]